MPSFPKPSFRFVYDLRQEIEHLHRYRDTAAGRAVPAKRADTVLIATWNIANLGQQKRRDDDYRLIAEIIGWFDLVAIQECKDSLLGLRAILQHLPGWRAIFSDPGGNDERMVFVFDAAKVTPLEKFGEIAVPPKEHRHIRIDGVGGNFTGFDRNPFIGTFQAGALRLLLVNAHFYYGSDAKQDIDRRTLEAYAVSRWGHLRTKDRDRYTADVVVLGDLNVPKAEPDDPVFEALRRRGLEHPRHSTRIASSIASDSDYDQIMFFPGPTQDDFTGRIGVFDFDGALFPDLWQTRSAAQFKAFLRYYVSDHRPLWAEFRTAR